MNERYLDLDWMRARAGKLLRRVAARHFGAALVDDMAMAGIEFVLRAPGPVVFYQDVRTAMLDELFRWTLGVTAHQGRRQRVVVRYEDWIGEWTRTARDAIERQVMARRCLRQICEGSLGRRRSKRRQAAIRAVIDSVPGRGQTTKAIINARRLIRQEIERQI